jgi:hypothetical protein
MEELIKNWRGHEVTIPVAVPVPVEEWESFLEDICVQALEDLEQEREAYEGTSEEWDQNDWDEAILSTLQDLAPDGYEFRQQKTSWGYWKYD